MEQLADDGGFVLRHLVAGITSVALAHIPIPVWRTGKHRYRARPRAMQLATARPLGDLRSLVLGDHPLKLNQ